jgi:hypothetical protein
VQHAIEPGQQAVRIEVLARDVDALMTVRALVDEGRDQPVGVGAREAGVGRVVPLHRGADGFAFGEVEVLAHADLVAVGDGWIGFSQIVVTPSRAR